MFREVVAETLDEYLNCGILAHGFARAECDGCGHSIAVAFSCKKRGVCPSCAAKRAVLFAEHMEAEVLEKVPHRHLVLSLPKRLRAFFRYDRRLLSILFTAAWQSIKELFDAVLDGATAGLVLCVQSHGASANFNPHLHGICTDGAFLPDGTWQPLGVADPKKLETLFIHRVLSALKEKELIDVRVIVSTENLWRSTELFECSARTISLLTKFPLKDAIVSAQLHRSSAGSLAPEWPSRWPRQNLHPYATPRGENPVRGAD